MNVVESDISSGAYGFWDPKQTTITLVAHGVDDSMLIHTFHHELAHAILFYAGREDLSNDETLTDVIGGLLAQYSQTSVFSDDDTDSSEDSSAS